jgi:hypothetical protein
VPRRITNLALLIALALAFATGVGAFWTGSARGAVIVALHGLVGVTVVALIPWKARVVRPAMRRKRLTRWLSYLLAALVLAVLGSGLAYATGVVRTVAGFEALWWHVAIALVVAPLLVWHAIARPARPRRTDWSRRNLLRTGSLVGLGIIVDGLSAAATSLARLPGAHRRFTGSYPVDPAAMPNTIWLADEVPRLDPATWRLNGRWSLTDLAARPQVSLRAVLDCTSGWYAEPDWRGVRLRDLLGPARGYRSVVVRSATGYWVRLPIGDLDTLLLATGIGGAPLSVGHGFPARLVAPNRRGYWWVKWVTRVELSRAPWWWQPPFPL